MQSLKAVVSFLELVRDRLEILVRNAKPLGELSGGWGPAGGRCWGMSHFSAALQVLCKHCSTMSLEKEDWTFPWGTGNIRGHTVSKLIQTQPCGPQRKQPEEGISPLGHLKEKVAVEVLTARSCQNTAGGLQTQPGSFPSNTPGSHVG